MRACRRSWRYDARDRLVEEVRTGEGGDSKRTTYTLSPSGNIRFEDRFFNSTLTQRFEHVYDGSSA